MNTTLKPALTSSSPQNPPVTAQLNKPAHPPQASPNPYGQSQSLVNSGHNNPNDHHSSSSHPHPPNPAHQGNHFSSSTNSSHYPPVNTPSAIPPVATTHPTIPNVPQQGPQSYVKSTTYAGEYQPNLGHPPNNPMPPVIQNIPATQQPQPPPPPSAQNAAAAPPAVAATPTVVEKPQSNGTPDVQKKTPEKAPAPQENHVSSASPKIPAVPSSPQISKGGDAAPPATSAANNEKVDATPEAKEVSTSEKAQSSTASNNQMSSSSTAEPTAAESTSAGISGKAESESSKISPSKEAKTEHVAAAPAAETAKDAGAPKEKTPSTPQKAARVVARKSRTPKNDEDKPSPKAVGDSKVSTTPQKAAGKSKRMRIRTQPYQSPLPEIEIITKISSSAPRTKNRDDKLIVFYKNEFLAVRNSEGSFYVCQAVQNIYKSSPKIKIRWLSQDKNDKTGEVYTPDFYDVTDFDCILTNLNLTRIDKGKYRLPAAEKERTDSILKRSLAVEKGEVSAASLTEEHPDGIDLSLYKEESQLKKRKKATKRKASSSKSKYVDDDDDDEDDDGDDDDEKPSPKVRKVSAKRGKKPKESPVKKPSSVPSKKTAAVSRTERAKKRGDALNHKVSPVTVDHKKAKVLAKVVRKTAVTSQAVTTKPTQSINKNKTKPTPPASKKIPPKPVVAKKGKKSTRK